MSPGLSEPTYRRCVKAMVALQFAIWAAAWNMPSFAKFAIELLEAP